MWVLFKKAYSGPLGLFIAGIKQDIPKETAEKLHNFCSPVPAPWDEHIDHKAIAAAKLKKDATAAIENTMVLRGKLKEIESQTIYLAKIHKDKQDAKLVASKMAEKASEKSTDSDKSRKYLAGLNRELDRKNAEAQIIEGKYQSALGEYALAELEAEDAKKYAAKLAEETGIEFRLAKGVSDSGGQAVSSPAQKSVSNKMN